MSVIFSNPERESAAALIELALAEDLGRVGDLTSEALIASTSRASVNVVSHGEGILAGGPVAEMTFHRLDAAVVWHPIIQDGWPVKRGTLIATVEGPLRSLLTGERTVLNFLMHLSGIATLTRQFVDAAGSTAVILDTRKTLPGWRCLEKYAVRAGGGTNHRMGLFDGCLIKDNHLAAWRSQSTDGSISAAIAAARTRLSKRGLNVPIEVEVDTIDQFADALAGKPDLILLDNMDANMIRTCAAQRDERAADVLLEVSGGVTLAVVPAIAATGVDRISVGRITHSAPALDLAFDWPEGLKEGTNAAYSNRPA